MLTSWIQTKQEIVKMKTFCSDCPDKKYLIYVYPASTCIKYWHRD